MDFSEFRRRLGAEPRSEDPEVVAARDASPEHRAAADQAEAFERQLERALGVPAPDDLLELIRAIPERRETPRRWWPAALAASLLVAVGAAGVGWKMNRSWDSVEAYVMDHYRHDGAKLVAQSHESGYGDVHEILARFGLDAAPELAGAVTLVKSCPTPEGKGVHMVLGTDRGPLTVIYMPDTHVSDGGELAFDGMKGILVDLEAGSAVIIGPEHGLVQDYYAIVHDAIVPLAGRS